jgi:hypothetical protein
MNNASNIVPFARPAPSRNAPTSAQLEAERRAEILRYAQACDELNMLPFAEHLASATDLPAAQVIELMNVSAQSVVKAQADALAAFVAKRKIKKRCIDILMCTRAADDMDLARWLAMETDVSAAVANEVMIRTRESEISNGEE